MNERIREREGKRDIEKRRSKKERVGKTIFCDIIDNYKQTGKYKDEMMKYKDKDREKK